MFTPGAKVGVAVSGGADSVALFRLLLALAPDWNLRLTALHVNHQLRGPESDDDARFVEELAREAGAGYLEHSEPVGILSGNLEEAGRQVRYRFFARAMEMEGLDCVATAHTRDDQAETVLFRLLRGTGPAGLAGILPVTQSGIVRPVLDCGREELREWLRGMGQGWREDRTNLDRRFSRARIRHDLLPALEKDWGAGVTARLARLAESVELEEREWRERTRAALGRCGWQSRYGWILDLERVGRLPEALRLRVLRAATVAATGREPGAGHSAALLCIAAGDGPARAELPGGIVERSCGYLRVSSRAAGIDGSYEGEVRGPGEALQGPGTEISVKAGSPLHFPAVCCSLDPGRCVYPFDLDLLRFPILFRSWTPGDRYQPSGFNIPQSVADLFDFARVPSWERGGWPIAVQEGRVIWARLFGPDKAVALTCHSRKAILFEEFIPL